ncbi:hypothetical protein, partial [Oleiphilus sp. HI0066]|uniref:hypothetical protein n=2 Tax=Oleiphilus TaxID=141450 RepID=UPI000ADD4744
MKNYILLVLALCGFPYGFYLGFESAIKSEARATVLESKIYKGQQKCSSTQNWQCLEENQRTLFIAKKARIEYIRNNDFNIELGE